MLSRLRVVEYSIIWVKPDLNFHSIQSFFWKMLMSTLLQINAFVNDAVLNIFAK